MDLGGVLMLEVVQYKPEHLLNIDLIGFQEYMKPILESEEYRNALQQMGPAFSGFNEEGKLIGVAGVRNINAKTAHAWAIFSKDLPQYSRPIFRAIKKFFTIYFNNDAYDRIQADVSSEYPEGIRFAQALGFEPEGIMKHYLNNVDHFLFAKVNPWLKDSLLQ